MIKNYKQFNEGINHLLVGPTDEEIINGLKNNPIKLYAYGYYNDNDKMMDIALKLITPENKADFVYNVTDTMVYHGLEYINYSDDLLMDDEIIHGIPLKFWNEEGRLSIFDKIYSLNMDKSISDLLYDIYEIDIELEDII